MRAMLTAIALAAGTLPGLAQADDATMMVRVIVELNVPTPTAQATPEEQARLLDTLHQAQDLLAREVEEAGGQVTRRYRIVPSLAVSVSPEGLARLFRLPVVSAIRPDRVRVLAPRAPVKDEAGDE